MELKKLGKYEIRHELGRGAMGIVYMAHDPVIQRDVAIKTMNREAFQDKEQQERFLREARSAGALQHSNIVTIYEMGIENETPYIVMEYVEGQDLAALIRDKALSLEQKLEVMAQLCDALAFAHSKGIIHRDIKPANIRIMPDHSVKIMDFGIAKQQDADFTRTGLVVGTLSYMSPEQVQGKPLDPRSDQFSAGVVFYQLLSGKKPFGGENITNVVYQIISFKAEAIEVDGVPPVLTRIVQKMMAPQPDNRFPSCRSVAEALRQEVRALKGEDTEPTILMAPEPGPAAPAHDTVAEIPPLPPAPAPAAPQPSERAKGLGGLTIALFAVVTLCVAAGGGVVWWKFLRKPVINENTDTARSVTAPSQATESGDAQKQAAVTADPEAGEAAVVAADDQVMEPAQDEQQLDEQATAELDKQIQEPGLPDATVEKTTSLTDEAKIKSKEPVQSTSAAEKQKRVSSPPEKKTEIRQPDVGETPDTETTVYKKTGETKQVLAVDGVLAPVKAQMEEFRKQMERMPLQRRMSAAKRELNLGRTALGSNQNRKAAVHFWKSTELNPRDEHAYAWLVITLVKMQAYEEAQRTIQRANRNGVSTSQMEKNIQFKTAYLKLRSR